MEIVWMQMIVMIVYLITVKLLKGIPVSDLFPQKKVTTKRNWVKQINKGEF